MVADKAQDKIRRTKDHRVHIGTDVYLGNANEKKELPFVLGVMAALSGEEAPDRFKDREFIDISRKNFAEVFRKQNVRLRGLKVPDELKGDPDAQLVLDIDFDRIEDLGPEHVARAARTADGQKPLAQLLEVRERLKSLQARAATKEKMATWLRQIIDDEETRSKLSEELGGEESEGAGKGEADEKGGGDS